MKRTLRFLSHVVPVTGALVVVVFLLTSMVLVKAVLAVALVANKVQPNLEAELYESYAYLRFLSRPDVWPREVQRATAEGRVRNCVSCKAPILYDTAQEADEDERPCCGQEKCT